MFLLQARQKLPQLAFFLVASLPPLVRVPPWTTGLCGPQRNYRVFHKRVQALGKPPVNKDFTSLAAACGAAIPSRLALSLGYT